MGQKHTSPKERRGTPGLDIFKMANQSISGYSPSEKTGDGLRIRQPFATEIEHRLGLYAEYHPHVIRYQRGDISPEFAHAHNLSTPIEVPFKLEYVYEEKTHEYLPDYIGTLVDGKILIAEAGVEEKKRKGQELAKADAARRYTRLKGGVFWIGTEKNLPDCWFQNILYLHARRATFKTFDEIATAILAHWPWCQERSVRDLVNQFGSHWSEEEVEAAVWKIAGDAAAAGRLIVDLYEVDLDRSIPLALLDPDSPPILPHPLPDSLETLPDSEQPPLIDLDDDDGETLSDTAKGLIPGPTFNPRSLVSKDDRDAFNRNFAAVMDVLTGGVLRRVAESYGMVAPALCYLVKRALKYGQIALVPYGVYEGGKKLRPEFQEIIRKLYTGPIRMSIQAIADHNKLRAKAEELTEKEGQLVHGPSYFQVWWFIKSIENEKKVADARSGLKHPPRGRMSPSSFVLSIRAPALICQVDEHYMDVLVTTIDGTVITKRVHAAVLVCVKTGAIIGGILSLTNLTEEDYMRLIKQAIEKKDALVERYKCKNSWPCHGKPAVIFSDRGLIFVSEDAQEVIVERLKTTTEIAPPYCPPAKGTVEAIFKWVTNKLTHRLPGTTKSTPQDRGAYQSAEEAEKAGITLDVLEMYFIQAIVDGYMREWDKLRKQTHFRLWEAAVRQYGIPTWLGSEDDLKLLLMRAVNRKNQATGRYAVHEDRISFRGRWYVSLEAGMLNRLRGQEIDIYFDRRDISVIYIFYKGVYVGEAGCTEFTPGRRVSLWEADAERRAEARLKKEPEAESRTNRQGIEKQATSGPRAQRQEAMRLEKARQLDLQRAEIHPDKVLAMAEVLRKHQQNKAPSPTPAPSGLAPAKPNADDRPVRQMAVRPRGPHHG